MLFIMQFALLSYTRIKGVTTSHDFHYHATKAYSL